MLANAASLAFATDMHANKHAKLQRGEKLVPLCMHDVKQGMDTILVAESNHILLAMDTIQDAKRFLAMHQITNHILLATL